MSDFRGVLALALMAACAAPALAQTNVSADHKYSWGENVGWMNWRDANAGAQGVRATATYLSGYVWCENVGWVTVGDGTPAGAGGQYSNADGSDTGVNILASGDLTGFGWGENIGWINFNTAAALGGERARFDRASGRFFGYAWGENVGWVNLNDPNQFVSVCAADFTGDGDVNITDFLAFLSAYASGAAPADINSDGVVNVRDFLAFLQAYSAGCI
jgi:hypothetical protein